MPKNLYIKPISHNLQGDWQVLSAHFAVGFREYEIRFRTNADLINRTAEPFVPIALIPAMRRHWGLRVDGTVAPALLQGVQEIQHVLCGWYPKFRSVPMTATSAAAAAKPGATAEAAFFSGGVDSFFTLMQHRRSITHLVFVHGFDLPLGWKEGRERMARNARDVAYALGLHLIEVETNMREFGDPHVSWPDAYCGAGMGAVALLLAPMFRRIYIPGSFSYEQLIPMGSHPFLDRHWHNGAFELIHDGPEHTRFDKIQAIAQWPLAASHLRVCYQKTDAGLNCGRCRKCLWTMLSLDSIGCLEKFGTLPSAIDIDELRRYPPVDKNQRDRFRNAIQALARRQEKPDLRRVLEQLLDEGARIRDRAPIHRFLAGVSRRLRRSRS